MKEAETCHPLLIPRAGTILEDLHLPNVASVLRMEDETLPHFTLIYNTSVHYSTLSII